MYQDQSRNDRSEVHTPCMPSAFGETPLRPTASVPWSSGILHSAEDEPRSRRVHKRRTHFESPYGNHTAYQALRSKVLCSSGTISSSARLSDTPKREEQLTRDHSYPLVPTFPLYSAPDFSGFPTNRLLSHSCRLPSRKAVDPAS